jgi:phosphinothricin acetyltransferase
LVLERGVVCDGWAVEIRPATEDDLPAITAIQNALIGSTTIEWTDEPHTVDDRHEWLERHRRNDHPVVVAEVDRAVVGFAAYDDFRDTAKWPGYRFTVEHTVHVDERHWGSGVGRSLIEALVEHARAAGIHTMVAAVDADNEGSVRFHERVGFVEVGRMPEVGAGRGRWLSLVLLQRSLGSDPTPPTDRE